MSSWLEERKASAQQSVQLLYSLRLVPEESKDNLKQNIGIWQDVIYSDYADV